MTVSVGLHRDMPAAEYHAVDALSSTRMTWLSRSPMYCRWRMENPPEPTTEMALGTALHSALLEPEQFGDDYVTIPQCDRRTREGKAAYESFLRDAAGKKTISIPDYSAVLRMRDSVNAHPYARAILEARIETELSGVWIDDETSLRCKFRADAIAKPTGAEFPTLVDIKTTRSVEPADFARSMHTYGYFRQLAFYMAGLAELDLYCEDCCIIAVESTEPYEVAVFQPDGDDLSLGRRSARALMKQYARCLETGRWPDRNFGRISSVGLSKWHRDDVEREIALLEAQV